MSISLTRLSGGNTPADGSDPRTFPAIWNASATAIEGALADTGASVTVSETAPVSPAEGDLWLNSTEAKMYVYYDDGTSAQWVAAVGGTVPSQGKILQVVSTTKTDSFSASVTANQTVALTGLSLSITPSSTSSKIFLSVGVTGGAQTAGMGVILKRDSTDIAIGDTASSRKPVGAVLDVINLRAQFAGVEFLDSPNTTSSITYSVDLYTQRDAADTLVVNRALTDTDNATGLRSISTITAMEVAG